MDNSARIVISDDVLCQELRGETVLLDLSSEKYFGLDPVATRIWQLMGEGRDIEGILMILQSEYEVDRQQLEHDLDLLLVSLVDAGLVTLKSAASSDN
jgi:hypothetical protein